MTLKEDAAVGHRNSYYLFLLHYIQAEVQSSLYSNLLKYVVYGAGEMPQWIRAQALF